MQTLDAVVLGSVIEDKLGNVFLITRDDYATRDGETFTAWHYDKRTEGLWKIEAGVYYDPAVYAIGQYREGRI